MVKSVLFRRATILLPCILIAGCSVSPRALTAEEIAAAVQSSEINGAPDADVENLNLSSVIRHALEYNHDRRSQTFLSVVARRDIDFANTSMLTSVMLEAGYNMRDRRDWSTSQTYEVGTGPGAIGPDYSSGEDRNKFTNRVGFAWSALDFGLSYFRAKQSANTYLIQQEAERRTTNSITLEVIRNWHTVRLYRDLKPRIETIKKEIAKALDAAERGLTSKEEPPVQALGFQRDLIDSQRQIDDIAHRFEGSEFTLNALLSRNPYASFDKIGIDDLNIELRYESVNLKQMTADAPLRRSEIRNQIYESRNEELMDKARAWALLPLPRIGVDANYNSNSFQLDKNWISASFGLIGNLANLTAIPAANKSAEEKQALAESKLHSMIYAVKLQVALAYQALHQANTQLDTAARYRTVSKKILEQSKAEVQANKGSLRQQIREEVNALVADLQYGQALIDNEVNSYLLLTSTGIDLYKRHSDPEAEVPETEVKFEPITSVEVKDSL